jgi:hypothetical protein
MKKPKLFVNKVHIQKSGIHGYGVYAGKTLRKGDKIEECYFIITKGGDKGLEDFYFDAHGKYAVPTGFGIVYNHSDEPNADYTFNMKKRVTTINGSKIAASYPKNANKSLPKLKKPRKRKVSRKKPNPARNADTDKQINPSNHHSRLRGNDIVN